MTGFIARVRALGNLFRQGARLMVGVPDYETYLAHMRRVHPERAAMTYAAFFRERQEARYGRGGSRGCC